MKTCNTEDHLTTGKKYLDRQICSTRESIKNPDTRSHISCIIPNAKAHFLVISHETKQRLFKASEAWLALVHWEVTGFDACLRQSNTHQDHNRGFLLIQHPKKFLKRNQVPLKMQCRHFLMTLPFFLFNGTYRRLSEGNQQGSAKSVLFLQK